MDAAAQQYQDAIQKYQPRSELSNQAPTQSPPSLSQSSFQNAPFDTVMREPGYEQQQLQQQVGIILYCSPSSGYPVRS